MSDNTKVEFIKCRKSLLYFVINYVKIFSAVEKSWIPFKLWPSQVNVINEINNNQLIIILKARQLGFTWMSLAYILWKIVFHPQQTVGMFSKGDEEAKELLARLRDMYMRLPKWMKAKSFIKDNEHNFWLPNGSKVYALSKNKGESWTFSIVLCDEFDRFSDADKLMVNVKPAIDAGGQMIVGSISDKNRPSSVFKNLFRGAKSGGNDWLALFIAWHERPDRDQDWYDRMLNDAVARHGGDINSAMDEMNQQYPSTPEDAMSPKMQNKRIPYSMLKRVYKPIEGIKAEDAPGLPELTIYREPVPEGIYVLGADPAEGVGGDDSACTVLDRDTGEEVAFLSGQFEPRKVFPSYLYQLAVYYNGAGVMVERNNHGHAVIAELTELINMRERESLYRPSVLCYKYDGRAGWLSSSRGKVSMYDTSASQIREMEVVIHTEVIYEQLASIDINTLRAPSGGHDDASDSFTLACCAREARIERSRFFTM